MARRSPEPVRLFFIILVSSLTSRSVTNCKALLPVLVTVVSYLPHISLSTTLRLTVVEVCVSASYFGLLPWKELILQTAIRIAEPCTDDVLLSQKLDLRARMLSKLKFGVDFADQAYHYERTNGNTDPRLNGYLGERIILEAKFLLDKDAPLDKLRECLHALHHRHFPSKQERYNQFQGQCILARALRNKGQFSEAYDLYQQLLTDWKEYGFAFPNDAMASYAEVICEISNPRQAIDILRNESTPTLRSIGAGSRIQLALGHAHLMSALHSFRDCENIDRFQAYEAECVFTGYKASRSLQNVADLTTTMKYHYYIACAGHAMARHLVTFDTASGQRLPEHLTQAVSLWEETQKAAEGCWPEPGFAELMVTLSLGDLTSILGYANTEELRDKAVRLSKRTGRQYHFTAQGTICCENNML